MTTAPVITCLNCGCTASGTYCPDCGQPLRTSRGITMRAFWTTAARSFARLTPGFWPTFVGLVVHPWEVIRQYIAGRRIKYSPPVTMVLQLLLYFTFIYTVLGNIFHTDFTGGQVPELFDTGNWLTNMLVSSDILAKILIAGVLALNCYIAYGLTTGRRYNFAEYLTAAIYMGCCFSIYNNLFKPLALLLPDVELYVKSGVIAVVGTLALARAFPIRQWWRRCLTWLGFMVLNLVTFLLFVLITLIIRHNLPA